MSLTNWVKRIWHAVPDSTVKDRVRSVYRTFRPVPYPASFVSELESLPVSDCGVDSNGIPWLRLEDGVKIFGARPISDTSHGYYQDDLSAYRRLPRAVRSKIQPECIRLALDVLLRYIYPHATPDKTPPYPFHVRFRHWFGQHSDTIEDMWDSPEEIRRMKRQFRVASGQVLVDAGACYGFGALAYSRMVGLEGRVISIEADPTIQKTFERNMAENKIRNVDLVRCGVWNEPGELHLHVGAIHRQDNSLHSDVYPSEQTVSIPTRTLDSIIEEMDVDRVDHVSITVNTAEVEALEGLARTMDRFSPNLSIAGWLVRDGRKVHEYIVEQIAKFPGYEYRVGQTGRILAWK